MSQTKAAEGEHAFLYQNENWKWTVYTGVFPDMPNPMLTAKVVGEGFDLFDDAVKFAKGKGFKKDKIVVQLLKRESKA